MIGWFILGDFGLTFWFRVHYCWFSDGELSDGLGSGTEKEARKWVRNACGAWWWCLRSSSTTAARRLNLSKRSRTPSPKQVPSWHIQSCAPTMAFMHRFFFPRPRIRWYRRRRSLCFLHATHSTCSWPSSNFKVLKHGPEGCIRCIWRAVRFTRGEEWRR